MYYDDSINYGSKNAVHVIMLVLFKSLMPVLRLIKK